MTTHRFPIDRATDAYALLQGDQPYLGILLGYPEADGSPYWPAGPSNWPTPRRALVAGPLRPRRRSHSSAPATTPDGY